MHLNYIYDFELQEEVCWVNKPVMYLVLYWILNISLFSVSEQGLFLQGRGEFHVECLSTTYIYITEKKYAGLYLAFNSGDTIKKYT